MAAVYGDPGWRRRRIGLRCEGCVQIRVDRIGSIVRRWRGRVARPAVSVVLGFLVLADVCAVCDSRDAWDSVAGGWLASHITGRAPFPPSRLWWSYETSYAHWPEGNPVLFDSWDRAAFLIANDSPHTLVMTYRGSPPDRRSFWAVTHEDRSYTIELAQGSALSPAQRAEARRGMAEAMVQREGLSREIVAALAVSDVFRREHFVLGYIHNGAALLVLCGFAVSLAWIPGAVRRFRGARALARGCCPGCGYSIIGLGPGVCPECGLPLTDGTRGVDAPAHAADAAGPGGR